VLDGALPRDMTKETPIELEQAIDRLLNALDSASDLGSDAGSQASEALHDCAAIARELGLTPEEILFALKPWRDRMAARAPAESRKAYCALLSRSRSTASFAARDCRLL
jgi:hypothetical protein